MWTRHDWILYMYSQVAVAGFELTTSYYSIRGASPALTTPPPRPLYICKHNFTNTLEIRDYFILFVPKSTICFRLFIFYLFWYVFIGITKTVTPIFTSYTLTEHLIQFAQSRNNLTNVTRWTNVSITLVHRLHRWPNIKAIFRAHWEYHQIKLCVDGVDLWLMCLRRRYWFTSSSHYMVHVATRWPNAGLMLATVADGGQALNQH